MKCECDIHELSDVDALERASYELGFVLTRFYVKTGDESKAAELRCLAARIDRIWDVEEGDEK